MNKSISKTKIAILIIIVLYLIIFTFLNLERKNYEFILYIGVVSFFTILIIILNFKFNFSKSLLIGLSAWGLLHMCGGYFIINSEVLYAYQIIPKYLRFDQFVHAFGFCFATLFTFALVKPSLKKITTRLSVLFVILFAGMGLGALNEIIEFMAVISLPETGVGDYRNTAWDLVFNAFGAIIAIIIIKIKEARDVKQSKRK